MKKAPQNILRSFLSEAPTGFEPVIEVLQTCALPLGHGAIYIKCMKSIPSGIPSVNRIPVYIRKLPE